MKRFWSVLLLGLLVGVVIGAAPKALKFPYLYEELNQPCEKTVFEWRCAKAEAVNEIIYATNRFRITHFEFDPQKTHLVAKVRLVFRPGVRRSGLDKRNAHIVAHNVIRTIRKRLELDRKHNVFWDWENIRLELWIQDKLWAVQTAWDLEVSPEAA